MVSISDSVDSGVGNRPELFERALYGPDVVVVDIGQLAALCIDGIPDTADGLRATCWQLLLGYLPADRRQWARTLAEGRRTYAELVQSVARQAKEDAETAAQIQAVAAQIRADIERTQPDISLFRQQVADKDKRTSSMRTGATVSSTLSTSSESTLIGDSEAATDAGWSVCNVLAQPQTHGDAMARALLVYARFNRGAGYAQGMNEVLAPLYHVVAQTQAPVDAEADAFHMLVRMLRGQHLDLFVAALDTPAGNGGGLQGALQQWWTLRVRAADPELWQRLTALGARPEHFAVRWLLVWGAREFSLPDVLALWDAVLASSVIGSLGVDGGGKRRLADELACARGCAPVHAMAGRIPCAVRVPCGISGDVGDAEQLGFLFDFFTAVLLALRPRLMQAGFDACLALLQGLRSADLPELREMRTLVASVVQLRRSRCEARAVRACCAVLASADFRRPSASSSQAPSTPTRLFRQITGRIGLGGPPSPPTSPVGRSAVVEPDTSVSLYVVPLPNARLGVFEPVSGDASVMRLLGTCSAISPSLASVVVGETMHVSVPTRLRRKPASLATRPAPPLEPWWRGASQSWKGRHSASQQHQQQQQLPSPVSPPCVCIDGSCCGMQGSLRVRRRVELVDGDSDDDD